jgi:hypothetical protein
MEVITERNTYAMMLKTMRIEEIGIQIFELVQVEKETMIANRIKPIDDGKNILLLFI